MKFLKLPPHQIENIHANSNPLTRGANPDINIPVHIIEEIIPELDNDYMKFCKLFNLHYNKIIIN